MGRKIRHHKTVEDIEEIINKYFKTHHDEVITDLLEKTGYSDLDSLRNAEYGMKFGFDCGFIWLVPLNAEMKREWRLDNGKYSDYACWFKWPYNSQSTTIKEIEMSKAVHDLGMDNDFYIRVVLD